MQRNWILVNQHCAAFLKLNAKDYRLWGVKLCLAVKQQLDDAVIGMLALCIDDDRRNNVAGPFLVCLNLVESGATGGGKSFKWAHANYHDTLLDRALDFRSNCGISQVFSAQIVELVR